MAVAVGLSAITSLTTAPALCALILRPRQKGRRNADGKLVDAETGGKLTFSSRFHIAFTTYFDRIIGRYLRMVKWMFSHKWMAPTLLGVACVLLVFFMKNTKTGLIPDEDTGTIFVSVTASPGYSLQQTKKSWMR
jgi:HAE1 family hydrophobic/amphiphilic exporter-1